MSILLDQSSRVLVHGITGWQARNHVPHMISYGTRVVGGISPGKAGTEVAGVPVFDTVRAARSVVGSVDVSVLFVPGPFVLDAALEAIANDVETVVVLAEGVPFRDTIELLAHADDAGVRIVGPNSQGIITPGQAKVGGTGGDDPDRMFMPGPVGVVSRSGGMGAETCWLLTRQGIGQSTYVAVGGELLNGTTLLEAVRLFEQDPRTALIVCFGEPGTDQEERLADAIDRGEISTHVIAHIPGDFIESRRSGMSFGHAGAVISGDRGAPSAKRAALRGAGATVAERWSDLADLAADALDRRPIGDAALVHAEEHP